MKQSEGGRKRESVAEKWRGGRREEERRKRQKEWEKDKKEVGRGKEGRREG